MGRDVDCSGIVGTRVGWALGRGEDKLRLDGNLELRLFGNFKVEIVRQL